MPVSYTHLIWDVLGAGGFLMTNYQAEIPLYFKEGEDLICFDGVEDLAEKAGYYPVSYTHLDVYKRQLILLQKKLDILIRTISAMCLKNNLECHHQNITQVSWAKSENNRKILPENSGIPLSLIHISQCSRRSYQLLIRCWKRALHWL